GIDALLSIAQMPSGIPVACMGIGKSGAKNAAYLAIRILGVR
ncbi:AIR carboxylase family protein, partial [bacterium]|nr:AIR carboxylase family protein [bacterium]